MTVVNETTAVAVADLRIFFATAANLYRSYVRRVDLGEWGQAIQSLSTERAEDAERLGEVTSGETAEASVASADVDGVRRELSFGQDPPDTPAQVMYRVQRAENQLEVLTDHLMSLVDIAPVRAALGAALGRIRARQPQLRVLRQDVARHAVARAVEYYTDSGPEESPPDVEGEELTVWFASNRERAGRGWSRRAGDAVAFGRCRVFVPNNRPVGSIGRTIVKWGARAVRLTGTTILAEDAFWADLRAACGSLDAAARDALVFLHGYHTSFEKAARRTAQLKADLQHAGPAAFFSWPSADQFLAYASDKAAIEGSETSIRDFLVDFVRRSGAAKVHIIAHSMGNAGLLRAMHAIAQDAAALSGVTFGQIVLAAPDVDTRSFRGLAQAYARLAARTTLYVAENDRALGGSKWLHGEYERAGLAPPVVVVPGVDTINVSQINLGLLGHSYVVGLDKVLGDIHALLRDGAPPERRFRLRAVGAAGNAHWEFKP